MTTVKISKTPRMKMPALPKPSKLKVKSSIFKPTTFKVRKSK